MPALTATTTTQFSAGSQTKYVFTFAAVTADDTFASGLTGVQDFSYQITADPTTDTSAGANVSQTSDGNFVIFPGIAALTGTLTVHTGGIA